MVTNDSHTVANYVSCESKIQKKVEEFDIRRKKIYFGLLFNLRAVKIQPQFQWTCKWFQNDRDGY